MPTILVDVLLLLILWGFAVKGAAKGGIRTVYGLASFLGAILLTVLFYQPFSAWLKNWEWMERWMGQIQQTAASRVGGGTEGFFESLPGWMQPLAGSAETASGMAAQSFGEQLANMTAAVVSAVVLYFVIRLCLYLLVNIVDSIFHLPVLHGLNKIAGILCGLVQGCLFVWIVMAALALFSTASWYGSVQSAIRGTYLARFFFDNNLLMNWISSFWV
jgi:uncharacterized membrane protein required for colicin V production